MFCGSQIRLDTQTKSVRNMLINIHRDIMEGRNKTEEFKFLLWSALNTSPHNKELVSYNRSQIWNATINNTELVSACGDIKQFIVPDFIQRINSDVFTKCTNLKDVTISDGVVFIGDNIFNNNSDITIHTKGDSCAAKYAAYHNIALKLAGNSNPQDIMEDAKQLRRIKHGTKTIRDNGINHIENHYQEMKTRLCAPNKSLSTLVISMIVIGHILFFIYITIKKNADHVGLPIYLLIFSPFILVIYVNKIRKKCLQ